jgi:hypothetical protein
MRELSSDVSSTFPSCPPSFIFRLKTSLIDLVMYGLGYPGTAETPRVSTPPSNAAADAKVASLPSSSIPLRLPPNPTRIEVCCVPFSPSRFPLHFVRLPSFALYLPFLHSLPVDLPLIDLFLLAPSDFVKAHFALVKLDSPGSNPKEIMRILAVGWKEEKEKRVVQSTKRDGEGEKEVLGSLTERLGALSVD